MHDRPVDILCAICYPTALKIPKCNDYLVEGQIGGVNRNSGRCAEYEECNHFLLFQSI